MTVTAYIFCGIGVGLVGLLFLPGAIGFRLRMIRLKFAEFVLFLAMAAIGVIGYGDKFSPTNDPPRSAGVPQLITPDPGIGPFTNIVPFEVSNLCFTAISVTPTSLWAAVAWPPTLSPTNDVLDLYARGALSLCDPWQLHGILPLAPGSTNVVFELQKEALPTNGVVDSCFLSVGTQDDTDGDGLTDAFERLVSGTDPYLSDTDGDGMDDLWEWSGGLDPLSSDGESGAGGDFDADGLSNMEEYLLGLSPVLSDSDQDGLSDSDECGRFVPAPMWSVVGTQDAVDLTPCFTGGCSVAGFDLPMPMTIDGHEILTIDVDASGLVFFNDAESVRDTQPSGAPCDLRIASPRPSSFVFAPCWGPLAVETNASPASRISVSGAEFYGVTNLVVTFENMRLAGSSGMVSFQLQLPYNPPSIYSMIASVHMLSVPDDWGDGVPVVGFCGFGGYPARIRNGYPRSFGAFLPFGTSPLVYDSDGDGIPDGGEQVFGTLPYIADTDGDGMPDGWEVSNGINPNSSQGDDGAEGDPDGDGLSNLGEFGAGTNPANADTDDDGLSDGVEVGQGSGPNDSADVLPVTWISLTGDLPMDEAKSTNATAQVKAGSTAFVGVFVHSAEYPNYTLNASEYNDQLLWNVASGGVYLLDGIVDVNSCHDSFVLSEGNFIGDKDPVTLVAGRFVSAPPGADVTLDVHLRAINISDGILPSTVMVGVFPLRVAQDNMPHATGVAETTDAGDSYTRRRIPEGGEAYITGEPVAPRITAQFSSMPGWVRVDWSGAISSERAERFALDDRTYPVVELGASSAYDIGAAMGEIVGGLCTLTSRVWHLDFAATNAAAFRIRGKNPLDADAKAYIDSNVDAEFASYAWMIAKHESKSGGRVYNQFNPANPLKELPNKTNGQNSWGWGIGQIDKGTNGCVTAVVYDWHRNVSEINATLRSKANRYEEVVRWYREAYQNDTTTAWFEPDGISTNVGGVVLSAKEWSVITLYNGAGGTPYLPFEGHTMERSPIHFDPVSTNWLLFTNSNDYCPTVVGGRAELEVE